MNYSKITMIKHMKNTTILPLELRKLGLTEKEARVYLAALELGYTSVQNIAKKAQISRPTAYEIIKSLEKKELISRTEEKNKRYFAAQSPDHLLGTLKMRKKELEEKEREFIRIIAVLRAKYYLDDKREIKVYQNKIGLEVLLDDFLTTHSKEIYVLATEEKTWPKKQRDKAYQKIKKRLGKINVKELSLAKNTSSLAFLERKPFKQSFFRFKGVVIIYDKIIILPPLKNYLLIDNKEVIDLIKSFFLLVWKSA
jgi:sugar-specific transcriptional regulator TrmB